MLRIARLREIEREREREKEIKRLNRHIKMEKTKEHARNLCKINDENVRIQDPTVKQISSCK